MKLKLEKKDVPLKNVIKDVIIFIGIFGIFLIMFSRIKFPVISGISMNPSFYDGERVIAVVTNDVDVGDVVIIWNDDMQEYIIKRVIGVAGDFIEIKKGGQLYRNGIEIYEKYILEQDWGNGIIDRRIKVPENEIFVLGDNRNHSTDSRILGTIPISDVKMKVIGEFGA